MLDMQKPLLFVLTLLVVGPALEAVLADDAEAQRPRSEQPSQADRTASDDDDGDEDSARTDDTKYAEQGSSSRSQRPRARSRSEDRSQDQDQDEDEDAASADESGSDEREEPRMRSREGFSYQYRMKNFQESVAESEMPYKPGTTQWQDTHHDIPEEFTREGDERASTSGALLGAMTEALGLSDALGLDVWEQTTRVFPEDGENAVGIIMRWGYKDDSTIGSDLRVHMARDDEGWYVTEIDRRAHCARGVTDDQSSCM